jgi:hypothetical protein
MLHNHFSIQLTCNIVEAESLKELHNSQSHEREIYSYEAHGTWNQELAVLVRASGNLLGRISQSIRQSLKVE